MNKTTGQKFKYIKNLRSIEPAIKTQEGFEIFVPRILQSSLISKL